MIFNILKSFKEVSELRELIVPLFFKFYSDYQDKYS